MCRQCFELALKPFRHHERNASSRIHRKIFAEARLLIESLFLVRQQTLVEKQRVTHLHIKPAISNDSNGNQNCKSHAERKPPVSMQSSAKNAMNGKRKPTPAEWFSF